MKEDDLFETTCVKKTNCIDVAKMNAVQTDGFQAIADKSTDSCFDDEQSETVIEMTKVLPTVIEKLAWVDQDKCQASEFRSIPLKEHFILALDGSGKTVQLQKHKSDTLFRCDKEVLEVRISFIWRKIYTLYGRIQKQHQ